MNIRAFVERVCRRPVARSLLALAVLVFTSIADAQQAPAGQAMLSAPSPLAASGLRMILSLLLVLGLLGLSAWGIRRWHGKHRPGSDSIEVVSGVTLGSKERVVLLRVANEQVLVGLSPAGMRRLHVIQEPNNLVPFRAQLEAVE